jgi:hypothetical protein
VRIAILQHFWGNQSSPHDSSPGTVNLNHRHHRLAYQHTMADALKAEGNKLFAAKDFEGAA